MKYALLKNHIFINASKSTTTIYELKKKSNFDEHKPEISLLKKGNFIKQHNFPQMLPASWNRIYIGGRQAGRG